MTDKKLRILHAAVSMNPSIGVVRQMEWEQQAAKELNLAWDVSLHTPKKISSEVVMNYDELPASRILKYLLLRFRFYKWLRSVERNYDLILLRHSVHDAFEAAFARKFGNKLLTVHHTLEIPELEGAGGQAGRCKSLLEKLIGGYTLRKCSGLISMTKEILEFEKNRIHFKIKKYEYIYPNGIKSTDEPLLDNRVKNIPEIIFIASYFADWHGLDLLLDAAAKKNSLHCIFHIVGDVPEELKKRCNKDGRFVLHGLLDIGAIKDLMSRSWCGLGSFALHRKKMEEACTLKVREYLDAGLAVYASHKDIFTDDFIFFRVGGVDLASIVAYAESMRPIPKSHIRDSSRPYIDKTKLLKNIFSQISSEYSSFAKGGNSD